MGARVSVFGMVSITHVMYVSLKTYFITTFKVYFSSSPSRNSATFGSRLKIYFFFFLHCELHFDCIPQRLRCVRRYFIGTPIIVLSNSNSFDTILCVFRLSFVSPPLPLHLTLSRSVVLHKHEVFAYLNLSFIRFIYLCAHILIINAIFSPVALQWDS